MISPPKPLPRHTPRPKPQRLPERKRMTICIGIVASDGVVIAADREESSGDFKNDTGKILHTFRGRENLSAGSRLQVLVLVRS